MTQKTIISGLILAGGAGRRVNGQDKGLLLWRGEPLIAHVANRLRPQVDKLLISCNRNAAHYAQFTDSLIMDSRADFQGPLAGVEAAIQQIEGEYLIVVACDTPQLPENLVVRLLEPLASGEAELSYADDGMRAQYLFCALKVTCLDSLPDYLDSGQRAVRHWFQQFRSTVVDFSGQGDAFRNYNKLESIQQRPE